ncbi:MAG TPA: TfoX/Sxy family protein [Acidimicrobiia bacterium]|jgi:TfoX/Sxy family transcriptional regulator of competence genes
MAYDEVLAGRVREHLAGHPAVTEKKMFGGIAFMVSGNMAVGVSGDELMVRVDPAEHETLLDQPGVRAFDLTGRGMKGWVLVAPESTTGAEALDRWIELGLDFAGALPPK